MPTTPPATAARPRLDKAIRATGILAALLIAIGTLLVAFHAPLLPDCQVEPVVNCQSSPVGQKIFYFHVPVAFAAYAAFIVLAVASYQYIGTKRDHWDALAASAAEAGVLFGVLTLFSGSLWGHLEWGFGYWDTRDMKLTLTLVMVLVYAAYLILRTQITDPRRRARVAAVYGLLGFATVPLSYLAQRIWEQSRHPIIFDPTDQTTGVITPGVRESFYVNVVAFFALVAFLILLRHRIELVRRARLDTEATEEDAA